VRRYLIRDGKITSVEFAATGSGETVINAKRFFGERRAGRSMPSRQGKALGERTPTPGWRARTTADPQSRAAIVKDKPFLAVLLSVGLLLAAAVWQFHSILWD
jgi:hypothetical protein